jgi:phosphate transport system substrate-binding protein
MDSRRRAIVLIVSLLAGCSEQRNQALNGAGATFVYPMMTKWAQEYEKAGGGRVDYQSIGSGGGIKRMIDQTVDLGCTDGPMNHGQMAEARAAKGEVIHIPLVMGAVVPAYNLPETKGPVKFSGPVLADIFMGKITRWNDPALSKLNPNVNLPDLAIAVHVRGDASGTTCIWAHYLSKVSPEWNERVGVGTTIDWPTGLRGKG